MFSADYLAVIQIPGTSTKKVTKLNSQVGPMLVMDLVHPWSYETKTILTP